MYMLYVDYNYYTYISIIMIQYSAPNNGQTDGSFEALFVEVTEVWLQVMEFEVPWTLPTRLMGRFGKRPAWTENYGAILMLDP